jgi:hypothetical protein
MMASAPVRVATDPSGLVMVTVTDTIRFESGVPAARVAVVVSADGVRTAPVLSGSARD